MAFVQPEEFKQHLRRVHGSSFTTPQIEDATTATMRIMELPIERQLCPFCATASFHTKRAFAAHVGKHMQEIALAALPPSGDSASDDGDSVRADESCSSDDDGMLQTSRGQIQGSNEKDTLQETLEPS